MNKEWHDDIRVRLPINSSFTADHLLRSATTNKKPVPIFIWETEEAFLAILSEQSWGEQSRSKMIYVSEAEFNQIFPWYIN